MPFTFKLSQRLARIRRPAFVSQAAALAILLVFACEIPSRPHLPGDVPTYRLVVSPRALTLQQNQSADLVAAVLSTEGLTANLAVSWNASSGAITDTITTNGNHYGRYRAGQDTGKVKVIVKGNPGGLADTTVVTVTPAPVFAVPVSPATATVQAGRSVQLFATPTDANGNPLSGRLVTWATTNPAAATVNASGLVSGVAPGIATITATCEGQSGASAITVTVPPVASVTVSPASASVAVGQTLQLAATPKDANGNALVGRTVTWGTTNAAVASVDGSGLVSGVSAGVATISAASEGQAGGATITVSGVPVASVTLSPATAGVQVGQSVQLTATPRDAGGSPLSGRTVTWTTSNGSVATVSGTGLVTGAGAGSATITATSEGQSATSGITVTAVPVASVTVNPATASVSVGQNVQLTAIPKDAGGNPLTGRLVTWTTSNAAVATVNSSGLVSAVATGAATITATSEGQAGGASITVTVVPVASVTVSPATASAQVGQTVQLTATTKDAGGNTLSGRAVTWATSNAAVAGVNGNGLVTAVAAGAATITASSEGKNGTASVTVTAPPPPPPPPPPATPGTVTDLSVASATDSSITLSFTEVNNGAGQPASYEIRWAAGSLSWGSGQSVSRGTCTTPLAGTAIGARRNCTVLGLQSGNSYQFQLVAFRGTLNVDAVFGGLSNVATGTTVSSSAPVATVTVSPATASVAAGGVQQFTALLKDAGGATLTGRQVTWSSSNPVVGTVSGTGLVTGLAVGTATLTATSEGRSGTASVTVTVAGPGGVVFESNWTTAVGTGATAVRDGTRWLNYWEFNNNTGVQLLSVVAGGPPGYANALKVLQRGSSYAANLQNDNVLPPSTDFYLRFYMRNDDNSSPGDHIVTVDTWGYSNLTFIRKYGGASSWRYVSSLYGCGYNYPIGHWGPTVAMNNGVWYRFEYFVHFVDPTHVQVHTRVYDANGTQIMGDADIKQSDFGGASWNGRSDWTWASYYAAGYSFCVDPALMRNFSLGNNGQAGASDTGLPWYFAGYQIRTDRWPGP
jgi:uncharacterized protein YjdB